MKAWLSSLTHLTVGFVVAVLNVMLGGCMSSPQVTPENIGPSGILAFVSMCCECNVSATELLFLPQGQIKTGLSNDVKDRSLTWSPDGQWLGVVKDFGFGVTEQGLRIVNITTEEVHWISREPITQFSWSPDAKDLFYLDAEHNLYQYTLANGASKYILDAVNEFSISHNGQWLGLSRRHPVYDYFTFQVMDLHTDNLFPVLTKDDWTPWSGTSAWSPIANEVAVIWVHKNFSRVAVYTVGQNQLHPKAESATARETYQRDYGEDLLSVEFTHLSWSLEGQLGVIRSATDAEPGGEILFFDTTLTSYHRLPVGENITQLVWLDKQWLVYVTGEDNSTCYVDLMGEIWLVNMDTLATQRLVTNTLSIERPAWRP